MWLKRSVNLLSDSAQSFLDDEKSSILYNNDDLKLWTQNIKNSMSIFGKLVKSYSASSKIIAG